MFSFDSTIFHSCLRHQPPVIYAKSREISRGCSLDVKTRKSEINRSRRHNKKYANHELEVHALNQTLKECLSSIYWVFPRVLFSSGGNFLKAILCQVPTIVDNRSIFVKEINQRCGTNQSSIYVFNYAVFKMNVFSLSVVMK